MKLVALVGSPHGVKGNTGRLTDIVIEGAKAKGAKVEVIALKGDTVNPCLGCDACHKKGKCVQKDEFEAIKEKILAADGLVLASPNYIFSVSAQMKAFMDRCCGIIHCLGFEGKYGVSVVTSGGGDEPPIADYMNHFLMTTGIVPVGGVWATMGTIMDDDFPPVIRQDALTLGERLVDAWKEKEVPKGVKRDMQAFHERMKMLITYRKEEWPYEYEYWRKNRDI